jgi:hypothetical protein
MIVTGQCCWLTETPIVLAEWFDAQMQEEPVQLLTREDSKYVSRCIPQGSEIPREDIETQVSWKVAWDSSGKRITNKELRNWEHEGKPGTRRDARLALAGAGQGN